MFANYFKDKVNDNTVVVSPDYGGVNRARRVAEKLNLPIAIVDKRRTGPNVVEVMNVIGDVNGKDCLIIDDIIDTAGSACEAARLLKEKGAKSVNIACSHGVFSYPASERLFKVFDKVVVTNSIPLKDDMKNDRVVVLSLAPLIAKVIENIESGSAMSLIYDEYQ
jgi:ribose-phosphate pyrophosphokinase